MTVPHAKEPSAFVSNHSRERARSKLCSVLAVSLTRIAPSGSVQPAVFARPQTVEQRRGRRGGRNPARRPRWPVKVCLLLLPRNGAYRAAINGFLDRRLVIPLRVYNLGHTVVAYPERIRGNLLAQAAARAGVSVHDRRLSHAFHLRSLDWIGHGPAGPRPRNHNTVSDPLATQGAHRLLPALRHRQAKAVGRSSKGGQRYHQGPQPGGEAGQHAPPPLHKWRPRQAQHG